MTEKATATEKTAGVGARAEPAKAAGAGRGRGRGGGRGKARVDRKQEVIDAAASIFQEKGYGATSIQDVADAVDILKGSLYYYIESKDDLLYEVIQEVHEGGLRNLEAGNGVGENALERLRHFIVRHMSYNADNLTKMTVFFHDFRSLSDDRRAEIVEERDRYDKHLRRLIADGQTEGSIRTDVDPKIAAFWILGAVNWLYQWFDPDGDLSVAEIADQFADLTVQSLLAPDWNEA